MLLIGLSLHITAVGTPISTRHDMERQIDVLQNFYDSTYAPKDFKEQELHWNLEHEAEAAKSAIRFHPNITVKDFQRLVKKFVYSMRDYHVKPTFFSTEKASLPFRVKGAEGRYFVTAVNSQQLSRDSVGPHIGDELLLFDGKPVDEVIRNLMQEEQRGANALTDQALAEMDLTQRSGERGLIVPKGRVKLAFRSKKTGKVHTAQMMWKYTPERIASSAFYNPFPSPPIEGERPLDPKKLATQFLVPNFASYVDTMKEERWSDFDCSKDLNGLGMKKSFLPSLGTIGRSANRDNPFQAYIFESSERKKIGFIRIPKYMEFTLDQFKTNAQTFEEIIAQMERETEALVIDQMNNPGGSPFYMYALLSTLSDQTLITPTDRFKIDQSFVASHQPLLSVFPLK